MHWDNKKCKMIQFVESYIEYKYVQKTKIILEKIIQLRSMILLNQYILHSCDFFIKVIFGVLQL